MAVLLARAGAQVSLLARGAHLEAIRREGLSLLSDGRLLNAALDASDDARVLGVQDLVLVTVKAPALPQLAAGIEPLLGEHTAVAFFQNGIPWWYFHGHGGPADGRRLAALDPGDALWQAVGPQRVIGGIASSACTLLGPGRLEVNGGNRPIVIGEPDGSSSARVESLAELLRQAGFPVENSVRIRDRIWTKLAMNLGSGPMGMLVPLPLKELYTEQACVDARFRIQAEVAAIADAWGCQVQVDFGAQMAFARSSAHVPRIVQDMAAGRKPEIESMFRAPLEMARAKGVAAPTLELLVALATLKARAAQLYP